MGTHTNVSEVAMKWVGDLLDEVPGNGTLRRQIGTILRL